MKRRYLCIITGMILYLGGLVLFLLAAKNGGLFQLLPVGLLLLGTALVCLALHAASMQ